MARTLEQPNRSGVWPGFSLGGESVRIALESLRSNKLRTLLTMLGIIIGVWSVVALMAIGTGAQNYITDQVSSIGTNLLSVQPLAGGQGAAPGRPTNRMLTLADAEALAESVPEIQYVAPTYQNSGRIIASSNDQSVQVIGVTVEYAIVNNVGIAAGQFLTEDMVRYGRSVIVLGDQLAEDLFNGGEAVGQRVRVQGRYMEVIGVLEPGNSFNSTASAALVPITLAQGTLFNARVPGSASYEVSSIALQVRDADQVNLAQAKVEQLLRRRYDLADSGDEDDFSVINQASLLDTLTTITTVLTVFLGAIAGISLLVGGIGVMNIMLVSVTERTREIGLRKAVGAKRGDILRQFLVEALVMSVLGGLVGLGLGYLTAWGVALTGLFTPVVTTTAVAMALGFSFAVGLFFGVYPARRAALLNPIQALRTE
jgi:putative ABC transport system permease protein